MPKLARYKTVTPAKAIELYEAFNGGPVHTRQIIALGLREGKIRARAKQMWASSEPIMQKAWKTARRESHEDMSETKYPHKVGRSVWRKSIRWLDDVMDWDFGRNRLLVTTSTNPPRRILLRRVVFHSGDLRSALDPGRLQLDKGSKRAPVDRDLWRIFWHELISLATDNGAGVKASSLSILKSDAAVYDELERRLRSRAHALATVGDPEIAEAVNARMSLAIPTKTLTEEINYLRKRFGLVRAYDFGRHSAAVNTVGVEGSTAVEPFSPSDRGHISPDESA